MSDSNPTSIELLELTEEVNNPKYGPQVWTLVEEVGRGAHEMVNLDQPYDDLVRLMSTLDGREITAIILWYSLDRSVVHTAPSYEQIGDHFGVDCQAAIRLIHQARVKMANYVTASRQP